jgi:hypothetical protein
MAFTLKLSDERRPSAIERRRKNPRAVVLDGIAVQHDLLKNPTHRVTHERYVSVHEDGQDRRIKKTVSTAPRPWFWRGADGIYRIQVKYGSSSTVEIENGKPTILAGKTDKDVQAALEAVRKMVEDGSLDEQIATAKMKAKRSK